MTTEELHEFRKQIDAAIIIARKDMNPSDFQKLYYREMDIVLYKLQEAKHWAGECLKILGEPLPPQYQDNAGETVILGFKIKSDDTIPNTERSSEVISGASQHTA